MAVLAVLVTLLTLCCAIQTEYFVKPNDSTACPGLPCHTLTQYMYLQSVTQYRYFASNTRISFLPGVHEVGNVSELYIENVSNLTLAGYNVSSSHAANSAKVVCVKPATLIFSEVVNLMIKHLSIIYCGYPLIDDGEEPSAAVHLIDITSLKLLSISVENSTGYGIVGMNILGNSSISHSRFVFNNYYTLSSTNCSYGVGSCEGGNMCLFYYGAPESEGNISVLSIDSCVFSDGVDVSDGQTLSGGLAISYYEESITQYDVDIEISIFISNVVSTRNVGMEGTNFLFANIGSMKIINITSSMANYQLPHDELDRVGFAFIYGEFIYGALEPSIQIHTINKTLLHISDSRFHDNNGGGFYLQFYDHNNAMYHVVIKNCSFQRNVPFGSVRIGQYIVSALSSTSGLEVLVQNTSFTNHTMPEQYSNVQTFIPFHVVTVYNLRHLKIINCTFSTNKQTALQALSSKLYFGGHVIFSKNNGTLGGAVMLRTGSRFTLMPHTHVQIVNNHAKRGGGIYIEDAIEYAGLKFNGPCFFQLMDLHYPYSEIDSVIILENNTADEARSALYGGEIDSCSLYTTGQDVINTVNIFPILFKILDFPSLVSQVSSNPFAVFMCTHMNFDRNVIDVNVYPGQNFKVLVALYGQRNGSAPGIVQAKLFKSPRGAHLAPLQETQETRYSCENLTYTIFSTSTGHYELIGLRVDGAGYYFGEEHALINATLLPCPPGFLLSNITAQCECAPVLQDRGLLCNISGATPLVQRTRSIWISTHHNGSDIILHDHCPLNYCKPTQLWVHLDHPDQQCAQGRSGILCGRCKSNLSLTFGTSQCLECTNAYLALLLTFALAGLMLVLLLIICNLTVSMGTINGLIFYANIVWVNHANIFETPNIFGVRVFQQVLAVFIAWLNLDLGIETCFVHGMDAYIQTWLQFAFPFYIWMIVAVIIYLSRRSITVVKLVGSSAVSVLATLFLLSYAKLQRTVIAAFSFTYIQNYYQVGRSRAVWLYDGNVPFLQGKHIALFLMALAVTLLFILPFTLLLLFAPCIQASNCFLVQRVKMKLTPLLDAYQGPYKDNFRFWTGLMLVVRSILLVGFGLNILGDPDINNLLIIVVLSCLVAGTGIRGIVYKNTIIHVTEISFLLNLIILSGWTIYNSRHRPTGDSAAGQAALVCTSTGIAFATFVCILTYHTYLRLKSAKLHLYFRRRQIKGGDGREREEVVGSVESAVDAPPKRPPTVTMIELRESLLTDN